MLTAFRRRCEDVRRRRDAGITLAELVVTMSLLSIVGALALTMFVSTNDTSTRATATSTSTADARVAMTSWTDLLRVAVLPDPTRPDRRGLAMSGDTITFNAQVGNLPTCTDACRADTTTAVTLRLRSTDDGRAQLVQTLERGRDTTTLVQVPAGAAAAAGDCVFHPYGYDGSDLGCGPMSTTSSGVVGRVDIRFTVTPATGRAQQFRSSVLLPGAVS